MVTLQLFFITGFVEFKWCEAEFHYTKTLNLAEYDCDLRGVSHNKNIDALGILSTQNIMELILIESSRFTKKEAIYYKDASLNTFKKSKVYSVHIIKTQVKLSELSLYNESHWKFVEKRSARLPTNWNDSLQIIQYPELLATLFDDVLNTQLIQQELVEKNIGIITIDAPIVGSISKASYFNSPAIRQRQ